MGGLPEDANSHPGVMNSIFSPPIQVRAQRTRDQPYPADLRHQEHSCRSCTPATTTRPPERSR